MDQIKLQQELTQLFHSRTEAYDTATQRILEKIPSVTEGIYDLLGLPHDNVAWKEINYDDGLLIIQLVISYAPPQCPEFVKRFAPTHEIITDDDVERIEQMIRIGVPRNMAFGPKEDILKFFNSMPLKQNNTPLFVDDPLTEDQLKQLKLFQCSTTQSKH
jgi:hypothetical protein